MVTRKLTGMMDEQCEDVISLILQVLRYLILVAFSPISVARSHTVLSRLVLVFSSPSTLYYHHLDSSTDVPPRQPFFRGRKSAINSSPAHKCCFLKVAVLKAGLIN